MSTVDRWMAGGALLVGVIATAVACVPPSVGDLPSASSRETAGDDDDTTSASKDKPTEQPKSVPPPTTRTDAGADAAATLSCTESGAVQFQGHCYFALTTPASWDDSKAACAAKGAHLATLTSTSEAGLVGALDPTEERWIGLRRPAGSAVADASYAWVTNEPRGFADWAAAKNEPDGSCPTCSGGVPAECARVLTTGEWADDSCAVQHPALCERD